MKQIVPILVLLLVFGCSDQRSFDAQSVVDSSIAAHGVRLFETNEVLFTFRDRKYGIRPTPTGYRYSRSQYLDSALVEDLMTQQGFVERRVDGEAVQVPDSTATKYSESINSVAYFFMLPLPLNDSAVIKRPLGLDTIAGQVYYRIAVNFNQKGGGADYQDQYRYWIGRDDHLIDYLAYNYQTNGGGVRFRQAVNRRTVEGLVVQDYINFRPNDKNTPLDSLPDLWERSQLLEVSRIAKNQVRLNRALGTANDI